MKIDLHTHCKPGSQCAHHAPELVPGMFEGFGAIVLTNHYYPGHLAAMTENVKDQPKCYLDVFHRAKEAGEKLGLHVMFGAEIKLMQAEGRPEFLLYGLSEQDFLDSFPLYDLSQKDLYAFCQSKNVLMIQAHPYRKGYMPADPAFMDGAEIYNSHPLNDPRFFDTLAFAGDGIKTAGSDFHVQRQAGSAGMLVPDAVTDQFLLRDYLRTGDTRIFSRKGLLYENGTVYEENL